MLLLELQTLLNNRKKFLTEQKNLAIQRGDLEEITNIESQLFEIAGILSNLQEL